MDPRQDHEHRLATNEVIAMDAKMKSLERPEEFQTEHDCHYHVALAEHPAGAWRFATGVSVSASGSVIGIKNVMMRWRW